VFCDASYCITLTLVALKQAQNSSTFDYRL
jgi:hypothetical protein